MQNLRTESCARSISEIRNVLYSSTFMVCHRQNILFTFLGDFVKGAYQNKLDKFVEAPKSSAFRLRVVSKAALTKARGELEFRGFVELNSQLVPEFPQSLDPTNSPSPNRIRSLSFWRTESASRPPLP